MKQAVIENPVINSPFEEPTRHFRFTDEGITNEIVEFRRKSAYFISIAAPKKKSKQAQPPGDAKNDIRAVLQKGEDEQAGELGKWDQGQEK